MKIPYFIIEKDFLNSLEKDPVKALDDLWENYNYVRMEYENTQEIISSLRKENEELNRKAFLAEQNARTTAAIFCDKDREIKELEEDIKQYSKWLEEEKEDKEFWCKKSCEFEEFLDNTTNKESDYKKVLIEVRDMCHTMLKGFSSECINITPYLTDLSSMENKIDEVLK